mmetsp:Transcript_13323/g.19873  ORF Transcript_13323/g.19873 Transcript_13323/m.19873 type:complete len:80 (+) Transcript_13323:147-386(+)
MAFILNVGDYIEIAQSKNNKTMLPSDLPSDFPSCDTPFLKSRHEDPNCDCYIDKDAVLDMTLDKTYKRSRPYVCFHEHS